MAAELMVDAFPKQVEAIYVHEVQERSKTYKYNPETWKNKPVTPVFFKTYPEVALHAATRSPPLLRISGLRRICIDAINDFYMIQANEWRSMAQKWDRHTETNQSLYYCNKFLISQNKDPVSLIEAKRLWKEGQKVMTPYGRGTILTFDPFYDLYEVELDWRPLDVQIKEHEVNELKAMQQKMSVKSSSPNKKDTRSQPLATVFEADEETFQSKLSTSSVGTSDNVDVDEASAEVNSNAAENDIPDLINESGSKNGNLPLHYPSHKVLAKIQCRHISKYVAPSLPSLAASKSSFSFWGSRTETSKSKPSKQKALFQKDDKCDTPYGCGTVIEYRENAGIVIIKLSNWSGICYLNVESAKIISEGFFNRMLRIISPETTKPLSLPPSPSQKDLPFPYSVNSTVSTPFGEGRVIRPLKRKLSEVISADKTKTQSPSNGNTDPSGGVETLALRLSSWKLADGSNPMLYCTGETALGWKTEGDEEDRSKGSGGIFSAFGSIVSKIVGKSKTLPSKIPSEIVVPMFERHYKNGAAVVTPFGNGLVTSFRKTDGVYIVTLNNWKMANNACPKIYIRKESLSCQISPGCIEGYPVLTSLGLSGTLLSVQPRTGVHVVAVSSSGMVCYLQPKDVLRPLKAAVNDEVLTPYGNGKVVKFRAKDDIYEMSLAWGAKLLANAESFDRDNSGGEQKESFGIDWVFRLFFASDNNNLQRGTSSQQRSRSNSVASVRTHSSRSLL